MKHSIFSDTSFPVLGNLFFLFIAFVAFSLISSLSQQPIISILFLLILLILSKLRYRDTNRAFSLMARSTVLVATFYIGFGYFHATAAFLPTDLEIIRNTRYIEALVIICGFIGIIFKPSFGLVPLFYLTFKKKFIAQYVGFSISPTDWSVISEVGIFMIIAAIILEFYQRSPIAPLIKNTSFTPLRFTHKRSLWLSTGIGQKFIHALTKKHEEINFFDFIVLTAIALHFSNYFYSAIEKITIAENLFEWILHNKTQYLTLAANEFGAYQLAFSSTLAGFVYLFSDQFVIALNIVVLLTQLCAIIALAKKRWIIWLTLFFDLMHIVIFLLSGIFFWKWIILNLAVVMALRTMHHNPISLPVKAILVCVLLFAPQLFYVARLGWFDTRSVNVSRFHAITKGGDSIRIPYNYFLDMSLTFMQNRHFHGKKTTFNGHFPTLSYGSTSNKSLYKDANNCTLPLATESGLAQNFNNTTLERFIRNHHQYVLSKIDDKGIFNYHLYPHHKINNFYEFSDFYNLDKREIIAYRFIVESACLDFKNGTFQRDVRLRGEYDIFL